MKVAISAGHGLHIRGASGSPIPPYLDEYDENVRVMNKTAQFLRAKGVEVHTYTDTVSNDQSENLNRLIDWHNDVAFGGESYDLAVSIHFNAYDGSAHGTECLWVTQEELAQDVALAISEATGLTNRGAKYRTDLAFLNHTREKAILVECLFCDHLGDCNNYRAAGFDLLCEAIASAIAGEETDELPPPNAGVLFYTKGACSWFGGPQDGGVDSDEGLAFFYEREECPHLMLNDPPDGAGLARSLDPNTFYVACRWDYDRTPKSMLRDQTIKARVRAKGRSFIAYPADWGPHSDTGRVADLSPALLTALDLTTDDEVEVIYPAD